MMPCPFCGGMGSVERYLDEDGYIYFAIKCQDCGATGECMKTMDECIAAWDRREKA